VFAWAQRADPDSAILPRPAERRVDFVRDIQPLFESTCIQCHARGKAKGGFSLETRAAFLTGGDTGPAAVPGKSAESYVVRLVAGVDLDSKMPKKGNAWTAGQVGLLRAWIDQGAQWDAGITFSRPEPANLKVKVVEVNGRVGQSPLDVLLAAYFAAKKFDAPAVVEDRVYVRRVYLDAIGLLPTPAQFSSFVQDEAGDKREKLVHTLLADRRGYADNWLTFWNDLLRNDYRGTGFIDGGRRQISGWLYDALLNNEPYDRFVAELVSPTKQSEGFARGIIWRGTVNASMLPPMQAAQNTAQVFMGVNLKCASCHDSFVNDWTLADAYGLAAVFSDGPLELVRCDQPTGKMSLARALYPQLGSIDPKADKPARMKQLSHVLTSRQNGRLSRTIVNRLWAKLLGRGLVEPLDDMDKPAWSADLLDWLAEDLVAHRYDLKHTIEVIMTSRAYQLRSTDAATPQKDYLFRGPQVRRLTAEQFCDALSGLSDEWARFPDTLDIDFAAAGLTTNPISIPRWIWTDQPVEQGQAAAVREVMAAQAKARSDVAAAAEAADLLPRHTVVFRKRFTLGKVPAEAYAALAASQGASVHVNGKPVRGVRSDGERGGRIALLDVRPNLMVGNNVIVLEVSSHTAKNLNDAEAQQYPASRNHLNAVSGVGFFLRMQEADGQCRDVVTDDSWRVLRAPEGSWRETGYEDDEWLPAIALPLGVAPVDEGPALPPIARNDFANEPIELVDPLHKAISTAAQPGHIRASLLGADTLMLALDRPNREQVMTSRLTAATTLGALELTHGKSLNERLKRTAHKLVVPAGKDPHAWITEIYLHTLGRVPSATELRLAREMLGEPVTEEGAADFLWVMTMLPEFDFIQ
jgi:hypothetical protein